MSDNEIKIEYIPPVKLPYERLDEYGLLRVEWLTLEEFRRRYPDSGDGKHD